MGALLFLGTIALYLPGRSHEFINYDDDDYVLNNSHVNSGLHWGTIRWALTSNDQANWHPVTWLSHALDCEIFGLDPAGHHTTNILLHACNALLLFLVLRLASGATFRSFAVACLFAIHPFNVGTVAWIAERKSLLCMLFSLLAMLAYVTYIRRRQTRYLAAVIVLFALALASKPMAVTLPILLLLLDYWPLNRVALSGGSELHRYYEPSPWWRLLFEKAPLFLLSLLSCAVTVWAQKAGGALRPLQAYPLTARINNAVFSCEVYIWKTVCPSNFSVYYPHLGTALTLWKVIVAGALLCGVSIVCWGLRRKSSYLLTGWCWFLVTLLPVIGIIQVGDQGMADRYAYLPIIGLFVVTVWGTTELFDRRRASATTRIAASGVILVGLSFITQRQLTYWQDSVTLWTHSLDVTSNNLQVEKQLANALVRQGEVQDALPHLVHIASLDPADITTEANLGSYYASQGDLVDAKQAFESVVRTTSGRNLGVYDQNVRASSLLNLGFAEVLSNNFQDALNDFREAAQCQPSLVDEVIANLRASSASASSPAIDIKLSLLLRARHQDTAASAALDDARRLDPDLSANKALRSVSQAR